MLAVVVPVRAVAVAFAPPEPSDEDDDDGSSDPDYHSEIPMHELFDVPIVTQTQGESSQVTSLPFVIDT